MSLTAPIVANELGFFDGLNFGDDRAMGTVARDTWNDKLDSVKRWLPGN